MGKHNKDPEQQKPDRNVDRDKMMTVRTPAGTVSSTTNRLLPSPIRTTTSRGVR
jgi:hypothetical protein